MVVRPMKHLGLEAAISRAAESLSYILKNEQEQCLKKFVADITMSLSRCLLALVSLSNTYYYLG